MYVKQEKKKSTKNKSVTENLLLRVSLKEQRKRSREIYNWINLLKKKQVDPPEQAKDKLFVVLGESAHRNLVQIISLRSPSGTLRDKVNKINVVSQKALL